MKEYECVELKHHKDVGKTIVEWQKAGWRLHTYTCALLVRAWDFSAPAEINHYLLFERGE